MLPCYFSRKEAPGNPFKQAKWTFRCSVFFLMVLSWILTFNMLSYSCKVGNVALGLSLSISQSEIWVNLLGHPPLGKLWHYVNTRLPQTSKLPKYLFLWRWSHLLFINNQVYPIGITGLLLTLLIPTEILMAYLVFHITAIFFAVISYLIFIPTGVLRGLTEWSKGCVM